MHITLTDEQKQQIKDLMEKISNLDLNVDDLKAQVQGIYEKLEGMDLNITEEDVQGFFAQIGNWFSNVWTQITDWFSGLFK